MDERILDGSMGSSYLVGSFRRCRARSLYWHALFQLGFGIRGPGCGAPARFVYIHDYMDWIDAIISFSPEDMEEGEEEHKIYFRRLSPIKLVMYTGLTDCLEGFFGFCI